MLAVLVLFGVLAFVCGAIADGKGLGFGVGFVAGLVLGPIGLVFVLLMAPRLRARLSPKYDARPL